MADIDMIFNVFNIIYCCFLLFPLNKLIRNIALAVAVLSTAISIYRGDLSAVLTGNLVVGFSGYLVEVRIPPVIAAFVTAEFSLFSFLLLPHLRSAVLTRNNDR